MPPVLATKAVIPWQIPPGRWGVKPPGHGRLGPREIAGIMGVPPVEHRGRRFGRMAEASMGKDTTTGHWEMMGIIMEKPFPVYPQGFPPELIKRFSEAVNRGVLGNKPASGTEY